MVRWYAEVNNIAARNHAIGYNSPSAGSLTKSSPRGTMPALLAALIALAFTTPADAAKRKTKPHTACVQIWDPGVGPMRFCPPVLR